jgi:hypothetical protein
MEISLSPVRILWQAWWTATIPEEHPVSIETLGPCKSKKCDILLESIAVPVPAKKDRDSTSASFVWIS